MCGRSPDRILWWCARPGSARLEAHPGGAAPSRSVGRRTAAQHRRSVGRRYILPNLHLLRSAEAQPHRGTRRLQDPVHPCDSQFATESARGSSQARDCRCRGTGIAWFVTTDDCASVLRPPDGVRLVAHQGSRSGLQRRNHRCCSNRSYRGFPLSSAKVGSTLSHPADTKYGMLSSGSSMSSAFSGSPTIR